MKCSPARAGGGLRPPRVRAARGPSSCALVCPRARALAGPGDWGPGDWGPGFPLLRWLCHQEKAHLLTGPVSSSVKGRLGGPGSPQTPTYQIRVSLGGAPDSSLSQGWGAPRTNQATVSGSDPRSPACGPGQTLLSHRRSCHPVWPGLLARSELRWGRRERGACRLRSSPVPFPQLRADPQPPTSSDRVRSHPRTRVFR